MFWSVWFLLYHVDTFPRLKGKNRYVLEEAIVIFAIIFTAGTVQCLKKVTNSWPSDSNFHNFFSTVFLLSSTGNSSNTKYKNIKGAKVEDFNF